MLLFSCEKIIPDDILLHWVSSSDLHSLKKKIKNWKHMCK